MANASMKWHNHVTNILQNLQGPNHNENDEEGDEENNNENVLPDINKRML